MIDVDDPITLQLLWNRLVFITDQADIALGRTAFSSVIRESHDYVTVLLDPEGNSLAASAASRFPRSSAACPWPPRSS